MDNIDHIVNFDKLRINLASRRVYSSNRLIFLRNKEFELLQYFLRNAGRVITRSQILEEVWDRNICCATNTIDVHVSSLRKKLNNYLGKNLIKTVHCVGYIFES